MRKMSVIAFPALLLGLAACGGGGSNEAPEAGGTSAGSATSSCKSMPEVTLGEAVQVVNSTPITVAVEKGFFEDHCVKVKTTSLSGSSETNAALTSGDIQFTFGSASAVTLGVSQDLPLVAISALDQGIPVQLVVSNKWLEDHNMSATAPVEDRIRGLAGATMVSTGTTGQNFMKMLLEEYGLSESDMKFVTVQGEAAALAALQHGLADVIFQSPPTSVEAVDAGYGTVMLQPNKEVPDFEKPYDAVISTSESYLSSNEDIVRAVALGISDGINFVIDNPSEAADIEKSKFPSTSPQLIEESLALIPYVRDGLMNQEGWDATVALMKKSGQLDDVDLEGHWKVFQ